VIIFMSDEKQSERYDNSISQLNQMKPEYIKEVTVLKGDEAVAAYGERGAEGVILIKTNQDPESYNNTLQALGMEPDHSVLDMPEGANQASGQEDYYVVVEEMPELIGGLASIQQHITYPEMARRAGIEGRVYVQFTVNEEGDVEDPRVIRGIGGGADEAALEAVKHAKFKPGMQRGRPVRVQYSLPVVFRLPDTGQSEQTEVESPESSEKSMTSHVYFEGEILRGTILDGETGEPLAGANVSLEGTNRGAATDLDGEFSFSRANTDATHLIVSYVGYQTISINLDNPTAMN